MNYRNPALLKAVSTLPCMHCGLEGSTQASHSNQLRHGKGKGIKAHDYAISALCFRCHYAIDQGKDLSKQERIELWQEAHEKTIHELFKKNLLKVL